MSTYRRGLEMVGGTSGRYFAAVVFRGEDQDLITSSYFGDDLDDVKSWMDNTIEESHRYPSVVSMIWDGNERIHIYRGINIDEDHLPSPHRQEAREDGEGSSEDSEEGSSRIMVMGAALLVGTGIFVATRGRK